MNAIRSLRLGLRATLNAPTTLRRGWTSGTTPTSTAAQSTSMRQTDPMPLNEKMRVTSGEAVREQHGNATDISSSLASDAWTIGQPTRMIAHKLLDRDRHMCNIKELWEDVSTSGMFRSRRHFKHCLKLMRSKKRVQVICLGPEKVGSAKLKFAAKLTPRGSRAYLWFRNMHRRQVTRDGAENGTTDASQVSSHGRGLTDVL